MIPGIDPLRSSLAYEPIFLEGRLPLLQADRARSLGLRDGQVIQATVQDDGHHMQLQLGGPTLNLPRAWNALPGQAFSVVVRLQPDGSAAVLPASAPTAAGAASALALCATGAQRGAAAVATNSAMTASATAGSTAGSAVNSTADDATDVFRLLQRSQPHGLGDLLASGALGRWLDPAAAGNLLATLEPGLRAELLRLWRALQRQMSALTPTLLRDAVLGSGLLHESLLLQGAAGGPQDLKTLLRRLQRSLPQTETEALQDVGKAIDDLESSQVQTAAAQLQGQVLVSVVIPFADTGPMELKFQRAAVSEDQPEPPFVVDVVARHTGLGPLWLHSTIGASRVALTMWAQEPASAALARAGARDLQFELRRAGLDLVTLEIIEGARPSSPPSAASSAASQPRQGHGVDLRA